MFNQNTLVSMLICGLLTACGGGDSSDKSTTSAENNAQPTQPTHPTQPTQPEPITYLLSLASTADSSINAVEQSSIKVNLIESTNSTQAVHYTFSTEPSNSAISASIEAQQLTIEIGQLENDEYTTLTITGEVEGKQSSEHLVLTISNHSANVVLEEVKVWLQRTKVYQFDDADKLVPKYAQAAYFAGAIGVNDKQKLIADYNTVVAAAKAAAGAIEQTDPLAVAVSNYKAATLTESGLIQVLSRHKAAAQTHSDTIIGAVNAIAELSSDIPNLPVSTYQYIPQYDAFSAIIGNPELGAFTQDKWSFLNDYSMLNQLVPALGDLSSCETN